MKKRGILLLWLFTILFIGNATQAKDYEYDNLNITANILKDGTIHVLENYTANFFIDKHGIIRNINENYSVDGSRFHTEIYNINVEGKKFTTSNNNGKVSIKIGDPNVTVRGKQIYNISYDTYGLIKNFSGLGYAELYRNIVGSEFDTNFNNFYAKLTLPKSYTGFTDDDFQINLNNHRYSINDFPGTFDYSSGDKIIIKYNKGIPENSGLKIGIRFPSDYFEFNHERQAALVGSVGITGGIGTNQSQNYVSPISVYSSVILGGIVFIIILFYSLNSIIKIFGWSMPKISSLRNYKIKKLKRKLGVDYPIVVQYKPPEGINSAEAGLLLCNKAKPVHMMSLIYKWLNDGLISISVEKKLYSYSYKSFIIRKFYEIPESAPTYEKLFFEAIVPNKEQEISNYSNFHSALRLHVLEGYGESKGWLTTKEISDYFSFLIVGIAVIIICSLLCKIGNPYLSGISIWITVGIIVAEIIYIAIGYDSLKLTEVGKKKAAYILGYREFISSCEEDQLRYLLKEDPLLFNKILPYAVVFGLETELIKKITPLAKEMGIYDENNYMSIESIKTMTSIISAAASTSRHAEYEPSYSSDYGFDSGSSFSSGSTSFHSSSGGGNDGGGSSR